MTGVRVERAAWAINEADAKAEGVKLFFGDAGIGPEQRITSGERAADAPFERRTQCSGTPSTERLVDGEPVVWSSRVQAGDAVTALLHRSGGGRPGAVRRLRRGADSGGISRCMTTEVSDGDEATTCVGGAE